MDTLVIYTTHQFNDNVDFFIKHGLANRDDVHFLFVINGDIKLQLPSYPNVEQVNRENVGHDFGGWSYGLFLNDNYTKYRYYVFINSTVRGPFMPLWAEEDWIRCFTNLITNNIKLVGISVSEEIQSHVQSMFFATDKVGVEVAINHGIFSRHVYEIVDRWTLIVEKEVGLSVAIKSSGYLIDSVLDSYSLHNPYKFGYCGRKLYPIECIFVKCIDFFPLTHIAKEYSTIV